MKHDFSAKFGQSHTVDQNGRNCFYVYICKRENETVGQSVSAQNEFRLRVCLTWNRDF
jgi:hypothetical protein